MSAPDAGTAHLTVVRRSPGDVRDRQMVVTLDGAPFTTLLYGEAERKPIPPGRHRMRVHNTLVWKTIEFDAAPGEDVRFTIINHTGWGTWWMLSLLGAGPLYVTIQRD